MLGSQKNLIPNIADSLVLKAACKMPILIRFSQNNHSKLIFLEKLLQKLMESSREG